MLNFVLFAEVSKFYQIALGLITPSFQEMERAFGIPKEILGRRSKELTERTDKSQKINDVKPGFFNTSPRTLALGKNHGPD